MPIHIFEDPHEDQENVRPAASMPLKSALRRNPVGAGPMTPSSKNLDSARRHHERAIETYSGPDPLAPWLTYIRWTQDTFPDDDDALMPLLERCTQLFKKDARYKGSVKYLKLWIFYADMLAQPEDVFVYLQERGIGDKLAMFYQAYAVVLESKDSVAQADQVYMAGLLKRATPLDSLIDAYDAFKTRLAERNSNNNNDNENNDSITTHQTQHATAQSSSPDFAALAGGKRGRNNNNNKGSNNSLPASQALNKKLKYVQRPNNVRGAYHPDIIKFGGQETCFEEYRAALMAERCEAQMKQEQTYNPQQKQQQRQAILMAAQPSPKTPGETARAHLLSPSPYQQQQSHQKQQQHPAIPKSPGFPSMHDFFGGAAAGGVGTPAGGADDTEDELVAVPSRVPRSAAPSPTINTKRAMDDVYAMFSDSPAPKGQSSSGGGTSDDRSMSNSHSKVAETATTPFSRHVSSLAATATTPFCHASITTELDGELAKAAIAQQQQLVVGDAAGMCSPVAFRVYEEDYEDDEPAVSRQQPPGEQKQGGRRPVQSLVASLPVFNDENAAPARASAVSPASFAVHADATDDDDSRYEEGEAEEDEFHDANESHQLETGLGALSLCGEGSRVGTPLQPSNRVIPGTYGPGGMAIMTPILETSIEQQQQQQQAKAESCSPANVSQPSVGTIMEEQKVAVVAPRAGGFINPFSSATRRMWVAQSNPMALSSVKNLQDEEAPFEIESLLDGSEADLELGEKFLHLDADAPADAMPGGAHAEGHRLVVQDLDEEDDTAGNMSLKLKPNGNQHTHAMWELQVGAKLSAGLSEGDRRHFHLAKAAFVYSDWYAILSQRADHGTLQSVARAYASQGSSMPATLAVYYGAELLLCVEKLHRQGILHCNITADAVAVRGQECDGWGDWSASRQAGWEGQGVALRDFDFAVDTSLCGGGHEDAICVSDPAQDPRLQALLGKTWGKEVDHVGAAGVLYVLLRNEPLVVVHDAATGQRAPSAAVGGEAAALWQNVFATLLNAPSDEEVTALRTKMEFYLEDNPARAKGVKHLLCKQNIMMYES